MSAQDVRAVRTAIIIAGSIGLLGMAWHSKANRTDVDDLRNIVLDHLCTDHPDHRRCK